MCGENIKKPVAFPWRHIAKEAACNAGDRFDPFVRKIPRRRNQQATPVFLPVKSPGQRSLAGYSLWYLKSQTQLSDEKNNTAF